MWRFVTLSWRSIRLFAFFFGSLTFLYPRQWEDKVFFDAFKMKLSIVDLKKKLCETERHETIPSFPFFNADGSWMLTIFKKGSLHAVQTTVSLLAKFFFFAARFLNLQQQQHKMIFKNCLASDDDALKLHLRRLRFLCACNSGFLVDGEKNKYFYSFFDSESDSI